MMLLDRLDRERRTVNAMMRLYCRGHHFGEGDLCRECQELASYADFRLGRCPYENQKPACTECAIHCYKTTQRERIREVMRYAGPRMLWRHPILAFFHLLDGRRNVPELKRHNSGHSRS